MDSKTSSRKHWSTRLSISTPPAPPPGLSTSLLTEASEELCRTITEVGEDDGEEEEYVGEEEEYDGGEEELDGEEEV